jgi:hypothetical protein
LCGAQFAGQQRNLVRMAKKAQPTEGVWEIHTGVPRAKKAVRKISAVEDLHYNNPYGYTIERVWFDGRVIFATEQGEVDVDPKKVKVAQEYQIVYAVKLNAKLTLAREPDRVPGQLNIYDSIPGMRKYSPIWQFNYVIVPRDYVPNALRSERDCLASGYEILQSRVFEN